MALKKLSFARFRNRALPSNRTCRPAPNGISSGSFRHAGRHSQGVDRLARAEPESPDAGVSNSGVMRC